MTRKKVKAPKRGGQCMEATEEFKKLASFFGFSTLSDDVSHKNRLNRARRTQILVLCAQKLQNLIVVQGQWQTNEKSSGKELRRLSHLDLIERIVELMEILHGGRARAKQDGFDTTNAQTILSCTANYFENLKSKRVRVPTMRTEPRQISRELFHSQLRTLANPTAASINTEDVPSCRFSTMWEDIPSPTLSLKERHPIGQIVGYNDVIIQEESAFPSPSTNILQVQNTENELWRRPNTSLSSSTMAIPQTIVAGVRSETNNLSQDSTLSLSSLSPRLSDQNSFKRDNNALRKRPQLSLRQKRKSNDNMIEPATSGRTTERTIEQTLIKIDKWATAWLEGELTHNPSCSRFLGKQVTMPTDQEDHRNADNVNADDVKGSVSTRSAGPKHNSAEKVETADEWHTMKYCLSIPDIDVLEEGELSDASGY